MDKKKVGIITYHCVCNFGAQLQTLSTVGFLKRKGYEPVVIHWYPSDLDNINQQRISKEQYACHIDFAEKNMPLTRLCRTEEELLQVIEDYNLDAIILGSDALFKYLPKSERKIFSKTKLWIVQASFTSDQLLDNNPFWGSFIPRLKRKIPVAVFSVSSQNTPYKKTDNLEFNKIKESLDQFKYITVRDEWTKQMVKYFLGDKDIPVTPDPVFSFNPNNYLPVLSEQELKNKYNLPDKYVLISFRFEKIEKQFIKELSERLVANGYTPIAFPHPEGLKDFGLEHKIESPLPPLDWYYMIKYSAGYIGERMHPIVTALHNAVPFFCFDHYGTIKKIIPYQNRIGKYIQESSKIYDILSKCNLQDYMVSYKKGFKKIRPTDVVNRILTFDRAGSMIVSNTLQCKYEEGMNTLIQYLNIDGKVGDNK